MSLWLGILIWVGVAGFVIYVLWRIGIDWMYPKRRG